MYLAVMIDLYTRKVVGWSMKPTMKVRFKGLQKNTAHVLTHFALSNLWTKLHLESASHPHIPTAAPLPGSPNQL